MKFPGRKKTDSDGGAERYRAAIEPGLREKAEADLAALHERQLQELVERGEEAKRSIAAQVDGLVGEGTHDEGVLEGLADVKEAVAAHVAKILARGDGVFHDTIGTVSPVAETPAELLGSQSIDPQ